MWDDSPIGWVLKNVTHPDPFDRGEFVFVSGEFLPSKRIKDHQPQYKRGDNIADYNQACHTGLSEQRGDLLRAGGWFGWELFTTLHIRQPDQTPQLFVAGFVEYGHIDKDKQHEHDRRPDPYFIPYVNQKGQDNTGQSHNQERYAHKNHG